MKEFEREPMVIIIPEMILRVSHLGRERLMRSHDSTAALWRRIGMCLMLRAGFPQSRSAEVFGMKHNAASHARKIIQKRMKAQPAFAQLVEKLALDLVVDATARRAEAA